MNMKSSKRLQPPPPFHIENIWINNLKKNSKWEIPFQEFVSSTHKSLFLLRCDSYYDGSNNTWLHSSRDESSQKLWAPNRRSPLNKFLPRYQRLVHWLIILTILYNQSHYIHFTYHRMSRAIFHFQKFHKRMNVHHFYPTLANVFQTNILSYHPKVDTALTSQPPHFLNYPNFSATPKPFPTPSSL